MGSCQNRATNPHASVITLKQASEAMMIRDRLIRSAASAIGIPSVA
ncbi:hypothetical protein MGWOODY_Smn2773 [hydrothermal vent metagenome]|uniref:Uncharacterized protein n=1 Tax=hydrothermal vent metagenome TaxID=652676 RepID=A0A160TIW0_9ZZZZ